MMEDIDRHNSLEGLDWNELVKVMLTPSKTCNKPSKCHVMATAYADQINHCDSPLKRNKRCRKVKKREDTVCLTRLRKMFINCCTESVPTDLLCKVNQMECKIKRLEKLYCLKVKKQLEEIKEKQEGDSAVEEIDPIRRFSKATSTSRTSGSFPGDSDEFPEVEDDAEQLNVTDDENIQGIMRDSGRYCRSRPDLGSRRQSGVFLRSSGAREISREEVLGISPRSSRRSTLLSEQSTRSSKWEDDLPRSSAASSRRISTTSSRRCSPRASIRSSAASSRRSSPRVSRRSSQWEDDRSCSRSPRASRRISTTSSRRSSPRASVRSSPRASTRISDVSSIRSSPRTSRRSSQWEDDRRISGVSSIRSSPRTSRRSSQWEDDLRISDVSSIRSSPRTSRRSSQWEGDPISSPRASRRSSQWEDDLMRSPRASRRSSQWEDDRRISNVSSIMCTPRASRRSSQLEDDPRISTASSRICSPRASRRISTASSRGYSPRDSRRSSQWEDDQPPSSHRASRRSSQWEDDPRISTTSSRRPSSRTSKRTSQRLDNLGSDDSCCTEESIDSIENQEITPRSSRRSSNTVSRRQSCRVSSSSSSFESDVDTDESGRSKRSYRRGYINEEAAPFSGNATSCSSGKKIYLECCEKPHQDFSDDSFIALDRRGSYYFMTSSLDDHDQIPVKDLTPTSKLSSNPVDSSSQGVVNEEYKGLPKVFDNEECTRISNDSGRSFVEYTSILNQSKEKDAIAASIATFNNRKLDLTNLSYCTSHIKAGPVQHSEVIESEGKETKESSTIKLTKEEQTNCNWKSVETGMIAEMKVQVHRSGSSSRLPTDTSKIFFTSEITMGEQNVIIPHGDSSETILTTDEPKNTKAICFEYPPSSSSSSTVNFKVQKYVYKRPNSK